jgi:hypothetical protein
MFTLAALMQGSGNENVQTVSQLFGLDYLNVLADNQGMISDPSQPLAGRSILLCGRNGEQLLRSSSSSSSSSRGTWQHGRLQGAASCCVAATVSSRAACFYPAVWPQR